MLKKLLLAALCVVAFFVAFWFAFTATIQSGSVSVPAVTGRTLEEAQGDLAGLNLEFVLDSGLAAHSEEVQLGRVVRQEPRQGSAIKKGGLVRVGISLGPARMVLPDLTGRPLQEAELSLRGIGVEIADLATAGVPGAEPGTVAAQSPSEGVPSPPDTRVELLVAGPGSRPAWVMPDFTGRSAEAVRPALLARGLRPERDREIVLPHYQEGIVMAQTPAAGSRVRTGDAVVLTVNRRRS
jgi:serine/threonine-protein kinase